MAGQPWWAHETEVTWIRPTRHVEQNWKYQAFLASCFSHVQREKSKYPHVRTPTSFVSHNNTIYMYYNTPQTFSPPPASLHFLTIPLPLPSTHLPTHPLEWNSIHAQYNASTHLSPDQAFPHSTTCSISLGALSHLHPNALYKQSTKTLRSAPNPSLRYT
jgi:hypothetical protein